VTPKKVGEAALGGLAAFAALAFLVLILPVLLIGLALREEQRAPPPRRAGQ
jgi:hypothetical protein